jgi:tRNA modification GTPase
MDDDRVVDEVIVRIAARNPDRLEINCHGGAGPHTAVMALLRSLGATECSWHNMISQTAQSRGLDTIQIEAAERLPAALTLEASLMLTAQYNGALSEVIASGDLASRRDELLQLAPYGIAMCNPPKTVITGRPNVGKSTLANALLGQKRVIESPTAGTTRDAVAAFMNLDGVPVELIDTAGLGYAKGELETLAAEKARSVLGQADLALCVLDGSTEITDEDRDLLKICPEEKTVVVINKNDLPPHPSLAEIEEVTEHPRVSVSAREKKGVAELRSTMLTTLFQVIPEDISGPIPFTERQVDLIRNS